MQFLLSEEKNFRNVIKEGNDALAELENMNAENELDRLHGVISWLCLCHFILKEDCLIACKDVRK